ncbi:hypothetical protein ACQKGC_27045 [Allorhizobium pseudoryzae]|uniref:hypothetical protein n=1 Tax=Allorhizobium pseudoryzae TaxID=379684 RepID=UPI003D00EBE7
MIIISEDLAAIVREAEEVIVVYRSFGYRAIDHILTAQISFVSRGSTAQWWTVRFESSPGAFRRR